MLDTDPQTNVMIREFMKDTNFTIRQGLKLELILHKIHSRHFLGLCEDVKVAIGWLKTRHLIFVDQTKDHDLVFGQSFLNS